MLGAYMAHAQVVDSTKNIDSTQQDNFVIDYANAKTFKLKDVLVTGDTKFSKNQIIRYAGFAIGEEIELPGTKVNNAVKKLWRSNLFSDIDLYVAKIEGDQVTLELAVTSVPSLGEIKINGVKKSQREDLIKQNKLNPGVKITQSLINTTRNKIKDYYTGKGFPNSTIAVERQPVAGKEEEENLTLNVSKGERVKIKDIVFTGNEVF